MTQCQHTGVYLIDTCHRDATHVVQYFMKPDDKNDEMQERKLCHEHAIFWKDDVERYGGIAVIENDVTETER